MVGNYNCNEIENEILRFWDTNGIYEKAKKMNKGKKPFYFLDGPPYTSGRVHIGTAWNKALKDSFLRYKRMTQEYDVWDRAGYDMHGLPIEHKVEEKLGIKDKNEIVKFGVDKYIDECHKLAVENMKLMNIDFRRIGVWMDFEAAYTSVTREFVDGEWWLIKKAHENKRLYEGLKTMTWCSYCQTALAKHELEYENVSEESIYLKFKVKGKDNEYLIIWTTTPWTIPFNLGIMVNPGLEYIKAKVGNEIWILSKGLGPLVVSHHTDQNLEIIEEFMGTKLEGLAYEHPLSSEVNYDEVRKMCKNPEKMHIVVLSEEYVDLSAGTGLVHLAPGCGPEDYEVGHKNGICPFNNLDEKGRFPKDMGKYSGWTAKKDDSRFIEDFREKGFLIDTTEVEHDYAHCWRCHNPVIYKTTKQWFFKVEDLKDQLIKFNQDIRWVPGWAGSRQFDSWLRNLRDNSITKQRFWGCPLPVWRCGQCGKYTVIGSLEELEDLCGCQIDNFHRPWIDKIELDCGCGEKMRRIPDVLDVWVDAGTVSWNCIGYPAKHDKFDEMFPPEFILEGKDQIRGWFNLLMVASAISMGRPSFRNVYMHGFINDAEGRKMSKSLGNYILPDEVISKFGADTLRYYMIGGALPAVDLNYNFDDMKIKARNLMILWNVHKYLIDYSKETGKSIKDTDGKKIKTSFGLEERYIFSKLNSTIKLVTEMFEEYRLNEVPWKIEELYLELSRAYMQLVREKSAGSDEDKETVLYTIRKVLIETLKMFSTIAPFISEKCYLNMKDAFRLKEESISHYKWPSYDEDMIDKELEDNFSTAYDIITNALNAREKIKLGVRWPLKEIMIITKDDGAKKSVKLLENIIKTQINVKSISILDRFDKMKESVKIDFEKINRKYKKQAPLIIAAFAMRSAESVWKKIKDEGKFAMDVSGENIELTEDDMMHELDCPYPYVISDFKKGYIILNQERTDELEAEGYARELMRRIQSARKKAGMNKLDRIDLFVKVDEELAESLKDWHDAIKDKVGAHQMRISHLDPAKKHEFVSLDEIKGKKIEIGFDKV
jgi:isoleucyl-tRNA synthetase